MSIVVATCALEGVVNDVAASLKLLHGYIDEAADREASLVVFPECALQGYPPLSMHDRDGLMAVWDTAVDLATDASVAELAAHAAERRIHVV
jgi:predicted amidohydrolase